MIPVNNRIPVFPSPSLNTTEGATSSAIATATSGVKTHDEYHDIWQQWKREAPNGEGKARQIAVEKLRDCLWQHSDILVFHRLKLSSLPVLPYYLKSLTLNHSRVTSLPPLPPGLEKLDMSNNQLTALPPLPPCLQYLDVSYNSLTQLNELPSELTFLNVDFNSLTALPTLAKNLAELMVSDNRLTEVTGLPDSVRVLNLNNNNLTTLPVLPCSLTNLSASNNHLTELPRSLPQFLESINLSCNQLTEFSSTLPASLIIINLSSNQLMSFSCSLPSSLMSINLSFNHLTEFCSTLPWSLNSLNLSNNQLMECSCSLPSSLGDLNLSFNQLTTFSCLLPRSLNSLNLFHNQLAEFSCPLPPSLWELNLSGNRLTELSCLLPPSLQTLGLENNRLSRLPESVMSLLHYCTVYAQGNPFPEQIAHTLQNLTFDPDYQGPAIRLPNPVAGRPERLLCEVVASWLPGASDIAEKWRPIAREENASTFSDFLNRLTDTDSAQKDPKFKENVAAWLAMLAQSPGLRKVTFAVALDATTNCQDRISYTWNEMQKMALVHRVENGEFDNQFSGLVAAGRVMFRLERLEEIAREKVKKLTHGNEEIETWLALQTMLRDSLALSHVAKKMHWFGLSGISIYDLEAAEIKVKSAENSEFPGWFSQWAPWHKVLERTEPERWQQATEAKYKALEEEYPRKVASELAAANLTDDADAERDSGKKMMEEMERKIFTAVTHEVLTARKLLSLINWQWPV